MPPDLTVCLKDLPDVCVHFLGASVGGHLGGGSYQVVCASYYALVYIYFCDVYKNVVEPNYEFAIDLGEG